MQLLGLFRRSPKPACYVDFEKLKATINLIQKLGPDVDSREMERMIRGMGTSCTGNFKKAWEDIRDQIYMSVVSPASAIDHGVLLRKIEEQEKLLLEEIKRSAQKKRKKKEKKKGKSPSSATMSGAGGGIAPLG